MRAITLWQPWASLLACGAKQYETRSWVTNYRGPIAIHAAAREPQAIYNALPLQTQFAMSEILIPQFCTWDEVPRGCIIATAELVKCHKIYETSSLVEEKWVCVNRLPVNPTEILFGDFTLGRYAWEFANMKMLPEPIPAKGAQRLWNWEMPERVEL